jgi:hypothetical protein
LYGGSDFVFTSATVDRQVSTKDEVRNRVDASRSRSGRLLLHAYARDWVNGDCARLLTIEPLGCRNIGKHISIGDILGIKEVGVHSGHRQLMLRTALAGR